MDKSKAPTKASGTHRPDYRYPYDGSFVFLSVALTVCVILLFVLGIAYAYPNSMDPSYLLEARLAGIIENGSSQTVHVSARHRNIVNGTPQDVWEDGGQFPSLLTSEAAMVIFSDSEYDGQGKRGAQLLRINGLTGGGISIVKFVWLNTDGRDPVTIRGLRTVNKIEVLECGYRGTNVGRIELRLEADEGQDAKSGTLQCVVPAHARASNMGRFVVPSDCHGALHDFSAVVNQAASGTITSTIPVQFVLLINGVTKLHMGVIQNSGLNHDTSVFELAPNDVVTVSAEPARNTIDISTNFDVTLVPNV